MIVDLPSTTTAAVNSALIDVRERGGAVALSRVLNLVIITDDSAQVEQSIEAANEASKEHPCRIVVIARGLRRAGTRLDAQIRVGGDAGASEVLVLRLYGALADHGDSVVTPLLLADSPVVAWWPEVAPAVPAQDPIGKLAQRRITDAAAARQPIKALEIRRTSYTDGDTDLAWTRITAWRALLAGALDLPPYEDVDSVTVTGAADNPSADLLAGWLRSRLGREIELEHEVSDRLEEVDIDGEPAPFPPGDPPDPADLLSDELETYTRDRVYEAAVRATNP
jgi:glucose-6-phosphate dehydrogenase assembly protein OpcA